MNISLSKFTPIRVVRLLLGIVFVLVILSLTGQFIRHGMGYEYAKGFIPLFNLDAESNVPTWYSSIILLFSAVLAGLISLAHQTRNSKDRRYWGALSIIFIFMSMDEMAMIHEYPIDPMRKMLDVGGFLYYPWVILGIATVTIVVVAFFSFWLKLPSNTKRLFFIAATIYVGGAIGIEMISAYVADNFGDTSLYYSVVVTFEELFEMLGIVVFIYALLEYIESHGGLNLNLGNSGYISQYKKTT